MTGDDMQKKTEEFYISLKEKLEATHDFPEDYLFKFIYPTSEVTMNEIKGLYAGTNAEFDYKASANRKYTSISIKLYIIDADTVINYYKEVAKIEGVIML